MITEVLEAIFFFTTALIIAYLVRHYIFTLTVLRRTKKPKNVDRIADPEYEPAVSILIPARDEEDVIGQLLQRMTELTYLRDKLQVIVIDDASSDGTGQIAAADALKCCIEIKRLAAKAKLQL